MGLLVWCPKLKFDYHLLMCLALDNLIRNHHQSPNDTCTKKSRNQSNITNRKSFVCLPLNSYTRHLNVPTGNHITHQKNSKNKKNKNKKKTQKLKNAQRQTERENKARRSAITRFSFLSHTALLLSDQIGQNPLFLD